MTYRGKVQGGVVVFEQSAAIPDGTEVSVEPVDQPKAVEPKAPAEGTLGQRLMKFAGIMKGNDLPTDGALNHDHYIYGAPKK